MQWLIWAGMALTVIGLVGIIWSIIAVARVRRAKLDEEAMKARMQSIVPINVGALMLSMMGLGVVIVGIFLS